MSDFDPIIERGLLAEQLMASKFWPLIEDIYKNAQNDFIRRSESNHWWAGAAFATTHLTESLISYIGEKDAALEAAQEVQLAEQESPKTNLRPRPAPHSL